MALPTASDNVFPKVIISEAAAPASPSAGQFKLYVDSSDHILKYKNSSGTVVPLGSGFSDPMTSRGDIIIRDASNVTARLAKGGAGTFLGSDGTDISWQTPSGGGGGASLNMVQWKQASGNTSLTLTMGATPTSGNIIVLGVVNNGTADLTSVTQTNVAWTKIKSGGTPDGPTKVQIWVGKVSGSAGTTVTIVRPGGNAAWCVVEYAFSGTVTPSLGQSAASSAFLGAATDPLLMAATTAGHLIVFMSGMVNQNQGVRMWPSLPTKGVPLAMAAIQCALSDGGTVAFAALDINASAQGGGMLIAEVT